MAKSRTTFAWHDSGGFLVQHVDLPESIAPEWEANSPLPRDAIIGLDDHSDTLSMLYADARGVCRVDGMSLENDVWTLWVQAGPGFYQRFEGSFVDGGRRITGWWEGSNDGETWTPDFNVTYTKTR